MGESVLKDDRNKRVMWQERLDKARLAYRDALDQMDECDAYYNGTRQSRADPNTGKAVTKLSSNVRNICYELIESQIDSTIPMPRVEAVHEEDMELAQKIEALLRNKISQLHFSEMNDLQERTVPIQGGTFWHIEWDETAGTHCAAGDVSVSDRHPKQVIPQAGVYEIEEMDYIFLLVAQTKQAIKRIYGVDVDNLSEEEPTIRGVDEDSEEDLITQNIVYYRNDDGKIGMFSWVDDYTLEDLEDYQARRVIHCKDCDAVLDNDDEECPVCGSKRKTTRIEDTETITDDITLYDGTLLTAVQSSFLDTVKDVKGMPVISEETGMPMTQEKTVFREVPYYTPNLYPLVLRRNIRHFGTFLGGSDIKVIEDQQDSIKKMGSKIDEKILKGGSFVTLPQGVNVETTDRELKIIRVKSPAEKGLIDVLNIQPDPTKERMALDDNYQWAKSTLGITDSFQGKYDSSARSGTAKQFSANQAAGRLQSKREMKYQSYARLYEIMFKFMLAYADQPLDYSTRDENGNLKYDHFSRWDFLRQDAAGELYWNDEFIFTVDSSATLSSNRDMLWQQIAQNYQAGAFGMLDQTSTQILLWQLYERTNYPYAGEIRQALVAKQQEEQQQMMMQQQMIGGGQNAMPDMQG